MVARDAAHNWVVVWTAMPHPTEAPDVAFRDATIRQTLRITTGGTKLRVRVSNAFGLSDLHITTSSIALPRLAPPGCSTLAGSSAILPDTAQPLTFGGRASVDIPGGAVAVSDPVAFPVQAGQVITLSLYLRDGQAGGTVTTHPGSRTRSWVCRGDHTAAGDLAPASGPQEVVCWYFISGVECWVPRRQHHGALALFGDSITDGRCSTDDGNDRWPDQLFDRMRAHAFARDVAVANQSAGGNRVLTDGNGPCLVRRLDRDLFSQPGVRYVMLFHGVNDIGTAADDPDSQALVADRLTQAYAQMALRAHAFGLPVFASPIAPFCAPDAVGQPYSSPLREQTRQRVNAWIRSSGAFDAVVDLDAVLRNPADPSRLNPEYDSGDGLHPNVKAFAAMAAAFPLDIFEKFAAGHHQGLA